MYKLTYLYTVHQYKRRVDGACVSVLDWTSDSWWCVKLRPVSPVHQFMMHNGQYKDKPHIKYSTSSHPLKCSNSAFTVIRVRAWKGGHSVAFAGNCFSEQKYLVISSTPNQLDLSLRTTTSDYSLCFLASPLCLLKPVGVLQTHPAHVKCTHSAMYILWIIIV